MRRILVGVMLAALLTVPTVPARADTAGAEAGYALLAGFANLGYGPVKVLMAAGGLAVGAVMSVLSGGDDRAANALWVPTASGTYFLTPDNISGKVPIEFIGTDYADKSSTIGAVGDRTRIYDAMYEAK
jgi:hypothetical protein